MRRLAAALGMLLAVASGCELAEVAAPSSEDVLVVEAVMRAGQARQWVLLHRSLEGGVVRGEAGASVTVTGPDARAVGFREADRSECLLAPTDSIILADAVIEATCYLSPPGAGYFVTPGASYELRIETRRGEIVRGRTTVPGDFSLRSPAVALHPEERVAVCALPDRPFELVWGRSEGAWAYWIGLRHSGWGAELKAQGLDVPDPLDLLGVAVSAADTTLLFPEHVASFHRGELDQRVLLALRAGLPRGESTELVILAADRNYVNAVRGSPRFNPSGEVGVSSVIGDGVGVFGSVVPVVIRSGGAPGGAAPPPC